MPASLLGRLTSAFRENLNDFLDVETPSTASPEMVRLTAIIDELRADLGKALAERRILNRKLNNDDALDDKAEAAIKLGREDLARAALARKVEQKRHLKDLNDRIERLEHEALALEELLRDLSAGTAEQSIDEKLQELDALINEASNPITSEEE